MKAQMTPRERVVRAIEFGGPDRVPVHRYIFPGALQRHGRKLVDFLNRQPDDFGVGKVQMPEEQGEEAPPLEHYRDEWGSLWVRLRGYTAGEVKEPALPTWDAFNTYKFPELPSFEGLQERIESTHHKWYTFGYGASLFERMQFI